jgi:hypothetical protein
VIGYAPMCTCTQSECACSIRELARCVEEAGEDDFHPAAFPERALLVETLRALADKPDDPAVAQFTTFVRQVCYTARR